MSVCINGGCENCSRLTTVDYEDFVENGLVCRRCKNNTKENLRNLRNDKINAIIKIGFWNKIWIGKKM